MLSLSKLAVVFVTERLGSDESLYCNGIPRVYIAPDKVVTGAEFVILRLLLPLPAAKEWLDHDVLDRTSAAVQIQQ
jgi:hypothetical protein